jgi:hypothetical protein
MKRPMRATIATITMAAAVILFGCLGAWAAPAGYTFICDVLNGPTMVGTEGDDVIMGTSGDDHIVALGGNDTIYGLDGKRRGLRGRR